MENNDTNTHYHKSVRVGEQKWEIVEIKIQFFLFLFFFFAWDLYSLFFYTWSFQAPPKKNHPHHKYQFPPKILIWPKSLLYELFENGSAPFITQEGKGGRGGGAGANYFRKKAPLRCSIGFPFFYTSSF